MNKFKAYQKTILFVLFLVLIITQASEENTLSSPPKTTIPTTPTLTVPSEPTPTTTTTTTPSATPSTTTTPSTPTNISNSSTKPGGPTPGRRAKVPSVISSENQGNDTFAYNKKLPKGQKDELFQRHVFFISMTFIIVATILLAQIKTVRQKMANIIWYACCFFMCENKHKYNTKVEYNIIHNEDDDVRKAQQRNITLSDFGRNNDFGDETTDIEIDI